MTRILTWLRKTHCVIFGHDTFDDLRRSYVWCVKCKTKWVRPERDPLLGEFYD